MQICVFLLIIGQPYGCCVEYGRNVITITMTFELTFEYLSDITFDCGLDAGELEDISFGTLVNLVRGNRSLIRISDGVLHRIGIEKIAPRRTAGESKLLLFFF